MNVFLCTLFMFLSLSAVNGQQGTPMRFETPKMNEEEQHSMHIPGSFEMQCDSCTAVAYQVSSVKNLLVLKISASGNCVIYSGRVAKIFLVQLAT